MGLAPFCTDSFFGQLRVRVWRTDSSGAPAGAPFIELTSSAGKHWVQAHSAIQVYVF